VPIARFSREGGGNFSAGMTTVVSLMMNKGYVIPAKAGIQYPILETIIFKLNLGKPDSQV